MEATDSRTDSPNLGGLKLAFELVADGIHADTSVVHRRFDDIEHRVLNCRATNAACSRSTGCSVVLVTTHSRTPWGEGAAATTSDTAAVQWDTNRPQRFPSLLQPRKVKHKVSL
jgi:hypothetical protein